VGCQRGASVRALAGNCTCEGNTENTLGAPDVLPGVAIRPFDITGGQCERPALTNRAQQMQAPVTHDEVAVLLDPHLRLSLNGYDWPFLLIPLRAASTLRHASIPTGAEDGTVDSVQVPILGLLIFGAAVLYSSVGHAGASGYLAAMALFGVAPAVMRPTALTLNIAVALITTARFYRTGHFSWPLSWPFLISSVPLAFVGGAITLPGAVYRVLVGLILLFVAYRMFWYADHEKTAVRPPLVAALGCGAVLGFISGLTGVGGGIFLSPLLLFMGWADFKQTAGTSSAFILLNSVAGLLGHISSVQSLPPAALVWAVAAVAGGIVGSEMGVRRLAEVTLRRLLAAVLLIAGLKLIGQR
jgi:uncharacterized protein